MEKTRNCLFLFIYSFQHNLLVFLSDNQSVLLPYYYGLMDWNLFDIFYSIVVIMIIVIQNFPFGEWEPSELGSLVPPDVGGSNTGLKSLCLSDPVWFLFYFCRSPIFLFCRWYFLFFPKAVTYLVFKTASFFLGRKRVSGGEKVKEMRSLLSWSKFSLF